MPTLPNVTSKFIFDYSDLTKAEKASAKAHGEFARGAKESTTHTLRFEQSLTTLMDHFGGMPPIVNEAGRSIESMASQGVTGMGLVGGAALVAVGAVAEVAKTAIGSYMTLGEQVENYRRVTGASAEESSRMVETFRELGVSEETATAAMFKLSKAVDTHANKLEALGITVAKDNAGHTDLAKTLLNVADAYNATGDQAKKNIILFDTFGKSGKDMIPILEQGSAALQQMEQQASLVFSEADLERLKQTKIHTKEVQNSWDEMWATLGQKLLPAQDALSMSVLRGEYEQRRLNEAIAAGKITMEQYSDGAGGLTAQGQKLKDGWDRQFEASQKLKSAIDEQAQATQDAAAANEALWTSTDKLITQEEAQKNAGFALQLANLAVTESQGKVEQAQQRVTQAHDLVEKKLDALTQATNSYGKNSEQARQAADDLTSAQLALGQVQDDVTKAEIEQEKSYYAAAAAARKLQEDTDLATTGQKDASLETKVYIDKLQEEANSLAPGSPLRTNLQAYINTLKNDIPREITTTIGYTSRGLEAAQGRSGIQGYAEGGRPQVNVPAIFGEHGPELWVPDSPGTVIPNNALGPNAGPVGGDVVVHVVVDAPIVLDGEAIGAFVDRQTIRRTRDMMRV